MQTTILLIGSTSELLNHIVKRSDLPFFVFWLDTFAGFAPCPGKLIHTIQTLG